MIAPTNYTDELDLFLYVSGAVQKRFDIAKEAVHPDESYQLPEDCHCLSLKEKFPAKAYYNKLSSHPPFGGEFDDGDDVIIPFPEPPHK